MKKIILALLVTGIVTSGYAQFLKQGSIIGSGSFDFQTSKYKDIDSKSQSFSISPRVGYLVIDNLVVGAGLEFGNTSGKSTSLNTKYSSNSIFFTPLVRYYLDQGLFFHGEYGFGSTKSKNTFSGTETTSKSKGSIYRLGLGYAVRITDTVLFEPMIGYYGTSGDGNRPSGLFINGGFTIILKTVQ